MKRLNWFVWLFILIAAIALVGIPVMALAQDVTPEVTEGSVLPLPEPTAIPTAVFESTPVPPPPVVVIPQPDLLPITAVQLAAYIVLAIAAGGGALAILYRVMENRDVQDTVERAYESWSPETQEFIKSLLDDAKETTTRLWTFLDQVTDGQPNTAQTVSLSPEQVRQIVRAEIQSMQSATVRTVEGAASQN